MTILITGATGFVGSVLTHYLYNKGYPLILAVRSKEKRFPSDIQQVLIGQILPDTDWTSALEKVDVVIHLAARVHIMNDRAANPLEEFRKVNTFSTINLAQQAVKAGVKRFIFISSIKVNGETNIGLQPFRADDIHVPSDPYGLSKYEAEKGLFEISKETGMKVVVIRPSLVYGLGVKGNFRSMMHWLRRRIPLPLGAIHNKRSFVAIDNLVDFIATCIQHPLAANEVFMVSDGEDISTSELLERLSKALGKPANLIPVPQKLLEMLLRLIGKQSIAKRLCGSLQVDIRKNKELLGWEPSISVDEGLKKVVEKQ